MLRYLMISLLTALTILLFTRSLVGAAEFSGDKIPDASEIL